MPAQYDFKENPNSKGDGEKQPLHPRIVYYGTIPTRRIFEDIVESSSYTLGDLEGMMTAITERMAHYMVEGYRVELGRIGYFSATLKTLRPVMDKKEIRSSSVYFDNINYRASAWMRKRTRGFVERVEPQFALRQSSKLSDPECKRRMLAFIEENGYITRIDYTNITGKLKNKALAELNKFVEEGVIDKKGKGVRLVFVKYVKHANNAE